MGRPVGVTILAVFDFIGAAFCALGGVLMILGGGFMATMMAQQKGSGAAGLLAGLGAALGVFVLICAALAALVGWGLLKLKNWARIVSIVLAAIGAVFQVIGLLGSFAHLNVFALVWGVFWLAIDVLIIWYLLQPQVAAAFSEQQARRATA